MKTLAFDCSGEIAAIAFLRDDQSLHSENIPMRRGNGGGLFTSLKHIIDSWGKPDRIVVGLGPGSFSGIRVAVSTAVGLKLATGAVTGGLPSVAALNVNDDEYLVTGDIRQRTFFLARILHGQVQGEIETMEFDELEARLGNLPCYTLDSKPSVEGVRCARVSAECLAKQFSALKNPDERHTGLQPLYLKPAHVTLPASRGSLFKPSKESSDFH